MDRAEAIGFLNYEYKAACNAYTTHLVNSCPQDPQTEEWLDALGIAIAALREQEQREQGCEVCREAECGIEVSWATEDMQGFTIKHHLATAKICPMCGRKLKEGADNEN